MRGRAECAIPFYYAAAMKLTDLECDILDHMWHEPGEPVRIRDLRERLNEVRARRGEPPYAYTTVATVVQNLRGKGAVVSAGGRLAGYLPVDDQAGRTGDRMRETWEESGDADGAIERFLSGLTEEQLGRVDRALAVARRKPASRQDGMPARARLVPRAYPVPAPSGGGAPQGDVPHDPNALISGLLEQQLKTLAPRRITKRAIAGRLGVHEKTVAKRMAGAADLPREQLEELVDALETPDDIRPAIFRLARRIPSPKEAVDPRRLPDMPTMRAYLDSIKRPSVLYDDAWDVVYYNKAYGELFAPGPLIPDRPGVMPLENGVLYMLFHPDAVRLLGAGDPEAYDRHWRTLAVAHFAAVFEGNTGNPRLKSIFRQIRKRPNLYHAYRNAAKLIHEHGDVAVSSEPRPFFDPRSRTRTRAQVLTEAHPNSPLQHATWMIEGEGEGEGEGVGEGKIEIQSACDED